jgi:hypothetical protein
VPRGCKLVALTAGFVADAASRSMSCSASSTEALAAERAPYARPEFEYSGMKRKWTVWISSF